MIPDSAARRRRARARRRLRLTELTKPASAALLGRICTPGGDVMTNSLRAVLVAMGVVAVVACTPGEVQVSTDKGDKVDVSVSSQGGVPKDGGYGMQIFAVENAKIFYVVGPGGKSVAARAAEGQSAIMPAEEAKALIARHGGALAAHAPEGGDKVKIKIPFVGIDVVSDESGDNAKVRINAGGQKIEVDANDAANAAHVRISGANADSVRDFIQDGESLSAETKAAMLKALGL
jgi:hypothetical protein